MTADTGERDEHAKAQTHLPEGPGDIPADTFAARLMLARHHAGRLSIEKAAEQCGLNSGNWAHWENGRRPLDKVDVARAVAEGLGMNFNWLLLGGPLLPARGRPVKRSETNTHRYLEGANRSRGSRPDGGPGKGSPAPAVRRPRLIRRTHPVAV